PSPDCTASNAKRLCMPRTQPQNPTAMNKPIFVFVTGTPTARAAFASPPAAKIQLPTFVRSSTQDAIATRMIQKNTVIFTSTPPMLTEDANTACADSNPSSFEIDGEDTDPPISRVRARFRPVSIRNVASVTMKDGSFVLTRIQPLMKPIVRDTSSAITTPTHAFIEKYQLNREAVSAEEITATPVERSNSPPIINSDTPTAMIPIVEDPYRIVAKAFGWVNVWDTEAKKMKRTTAPTRAPTSGLPRNFWTGLRRPIRSSPGAEAGAGGRVAVFAIGRT